MKDENTDDYSGNGFHGSENGSHGRSYARDGADEREVGNDGGQECQQKGVSEVASS